MGVKSLSTIEFAHMQSRRPEARYSGPTCRAVSTWGHCPRPRPDDGDFCEWHHTRMTTESDTPS